MHIDLTGAPAEQCIKPIPCDADQSIMFYPRSSVSAINNRTGESRISAPSIFVAQQTSRVNIQMGTDHLIIQVCFRPGVIHQLLDRMAISAFDGKELDTRHFPDREMEILNERLRETESHSKMIHLIEDYLVGKVQRSKVSLLPIDKAIAHLKYSETPVTLDWLSDQACLSTRQFERSFLERMGMSPKFFSRMVRFDRLYKAKLRQPQLQWQELAFRFGYFDFSHLMRDFRQFADTTPTMMMLQENASPGNRV